MAIHKFDAAGTASEKLDPLTSIGHVHLVVADLERSLAFYEGVLGFRLRWRDRSEARLGAGKGDLIVLTEEPGAVPRPRGTTGLFHLAVLVPDRHSLASSLFRLADARYPLLGTSDHLVSEALYLNDPDGNGIELYRDRPRQTWERREDGQVRLDTLPLDVNNLLAELDGEPPQKELPRLARIGHVHLQVGDLGEAEHFYGGLLGFDLSTRYPGSACFLSAGGYHHHIGLNVWAGVGAPPPPPGTVGLRRFAVLLPNGGELARTTRRLKKAGIEADERMGSALFKDPWENNILLAVESTNS